MNIFELYIFIPINLSEDDIKEDISMLFERLRNNGQVNNSDMNYCYRNDNLITIDLCTLSKTFLNRKYNNHSVNNAYKTLREKGLKTKIVKKGSYFKDGKSFARLDDVKRIVINSFLGIDGSVISDLDSSLNIQLCEIPKTYENCYYNVIMWKNQAEVLSELYFSCFVGEVFAKNQLFKPNSKFNTYGLALRKKISDILPDKLVYYFIPREDRKKNVCKQCNLKLNETSFQENQFNYFCDNCFIVTN